MQIRRYKNGVWASLGLLAYLLVCYVGPIGVLMDEAAFTTFFRNLGFVGALLFVVIFTGATTLGFPGNVLSVAAGAIFGLTWGTVWSVVGATLGATGAFWLARHTLHEMVNRRFGHHPMLKRLNRAIDHYPLNIVMAVRFTPLSPFSLVNFLFGLTSLNLKTYVLGTFIGIIPLSIAYAWLGAAGKQALSGGDRVPLVFALTMLSVLSVLPMFWQRGQKEKEPKKVKREKVKVKL